MAKDFVPLGRRTGCGDDRHPLRSVRAARGLSVNRLLARYGPEASIRDIMHQQIGACPHRNYTQLYPAAIPYMRRSLSSVIFGDLNP